MSEQKIEGMPGGWRLVRIGRPKVGEWFIDSDDGKPLEATYGPVIGVRAIIEKIATYRDVTPDDVGKTVEIRQGDKWHERKLLAVLPETFDYRYIYQTVYQTTRAVGNDWSYISHPPRIKE